jgi:hypothetical protein
MRELLILALHVLVTLAKMLRPGGVRAVAAESVLRVAEAAKARPPWEIRLEFLARSAREACAARSAYE